MKSTYNLVTGVLIIFLIAGLIYTNILLEETTLKANSLEFKIENTNERIDDVVNRINYYHQKEIDQAAIEQYKSEVRIKELMIKMREGKIEIEKKK